MTDKQILFSITAKDCRFDYFNGTGNGGQNRNKVKAAVRCTHIASGSVGVCQEERSQQQNKRIAFTRMANTPVFKKWHKIEVAKKIGMYADLDEEVDALMRPTNLVIEEKINGRWIKATE